jgi:hypothetical protein
MPVAPTPTPTTGFAHTNLRFVKLLDHRLVGREALDVLDDLLVLLD